MQQKNNVCVWNFVFNYEKVLECKTSVKNNEQPCRPSTSKTNITVTHVHEIIRNNYQLTIREVTEDMEISNGSC